MTRREQAKFVKDLTKAVALDLIKKLPQVPSTKTWDGHELRVRLAEKFQSEADISLIKRNGKSDRAMDYRNTVVTTNI
jgi:hypothetical protein